MATYTLEYFTGSTNGVPVAVTSTNSAGATAFHTTSTNKEELFVYAYNNHTVDVEIGVDFGSTTSPVRVSIPAKAGPVVVIPGWPLRNGRTVAAFCSTVSTSALFVAGHVLKVT